MMCNRSKWSTFGCLCLVATCFAALFGCRGGGANERILVPLDANIPYVNNDHILIDKAPKLVEIGSDPLPDGALKIRTYLASPDAFVVDTLDIFVSAKYRIHALKDDRLIILDFRKDELIEYLPQTKESITIASFGRGPGELAFSKDVVIDGASVYVARADRIISEFDCSASPCVYKKSISIDTGLYSITLVGSDSFAVQGPTPVQDTGGNPVSDALEDRKAVRVIGRDGGSGREFAATYDTEGHWMLLRPFVSGGAVNYIDKQRTYVVYFDRFPYLYFYDETGSMVKSYRIEDFITGRQKYTPNTGQLQIVLSDHSVISSTAILDSDFLLVEITTRKNNRVEDRAFKWDIDRDYYCINVVTNDSHYLGRASSSDDGSASRLIVVPEGLIVDNDGVLLFAHGPS